MDTETRVREMLSESGIEGEGVLELLECLTQLDRYVDDTPPEPTPELAALIAGTVGTVVKAPFARRRSRMLIAGAAALGTVGVGGIAAVANELPPAAQSLVAEFSDRYLPFGLPYPDEHREPRPDPVEPVEPTTELVPATTLPEDDDVAPKPATTEPSTAPSTAPTPSAEPSREPSSAGTAPAPAPTPSATSGGSSTPEGGSTGSGDPQAGPTSSASPSPDPSSTDGSEPSADPSTTTDPSPTANTRTEVTDEPSPSASAGTASPAPSVSASSAWSDAEG